MLILNQIKERPGLFISHKVYCLEDSFRILRFDKYCISNGYKQWTFSEYWISSRNLYNSLYVEDQDPRFFPGSFRNSRLSEIFVFMNARIRYRYERREH